jgi:type IV pilus assembly protein PilV
MVAIFVFSVGLLGLATMQVAAVRGNNFSDTLTEAANLATDRMEKIMAAGYATVDDTDDDGAGGLNDATGATADDQDAQGIYRIFWNVAEDVTTNNTKTVNIIITWVERGATRTLAMQGIKAR